MNVLMVDQFGETGGAQKCLLDLISGWPDGDVVVVAAPADGTLLRSVQAAGFATAAITCGSYTAGKKSAFDALRFCSDLFRQRVTLRRIIRRYGIDVVYVNGPRVLPGAALAARGRCPVIFHAHNHLQRRSDIVMVRSALRRCSSTVIACCEHVATPLAARHRTCGGSRVFIGIGANATGVSCPRMPMVIRNGVPDAGFRARQYPPEGPWRIGIVGRISPEKAHLVLLEAVRLMAAEGYQITVTVAGASLFSSNDYETEVRRRSARLDVRFTGWIEDVGALLGGLDLLAVPSIAEPGLPRVVLEAFSAGVPVVALPSGGIPEAVRDNVTGFLAADATPAGLAARLRTVMLNSPWELARVIQSARAEWERYWNVDRWRREVIPVIRTAAKEPEEVPDSLAASATASGGRPIPSV